MTSPHDSAHLDPDMSHHNHSVHHQSNHESLHHNATNGQHEGGIHVFVFAFDYVAEPFILTCFLFALVIIMIAYHHIKPLAKHVPESCALIVIGMLIGLVLNIMLESAYSLRDRAFAENLGTILLYAVVGTIMNTFLMAALIWGLQAVHIIEGDMSRIDVLVFTAVISAVDPVAVLAIFEEVGVNKMLYFMVFGESLLNDAVTVVIYKLMIAFRTIPEITITEIMLGVASFFFVSIGALLIGAIWGLLCTIITKHTTYIRLVEPVIVFATAYAAYLFAEMFHFSGIISIIACGVLQAQFANENLSVKSYITIEYAIKSMAKIMESLIFIILGVMLISVVFFLTGIVNWFEKGFRRISFKEQIIMGYGGLRGAMAFSLAFMLDKDMPHRDLILTTTYLVLLFSVFVQGVTMKPLVKFLHITLAADKSDPHLEFFLAFHRSVELNLLSGVEEIIGYHGQYYWTNLTKSFTQKVIRPALQKNPTSSARNLVTLNNQLELQFRYEFS